MHAGWTWNAVGRIVPEPGPELGVKRSALAVIVVRFT